MREGLRIATAAQDRGGTATVLQQLGLVALAQQAPEEAMYLFREALALLRTSGDRSSELARTLNLFGVALLASGKNNEAGRVYREALDTALEAQAAPDVLQALAGLAVCYECEGRYSDALALAARVLIEPGGRRETYAQARQLQAALRAQFPHEQVRQIEANGRSQPLSELVDE